MSNLTKIDEIKKELEISFGSLFPQLNIDEIPNDLFKLKKLCNEEVLTHTDALRKEIFFYDRNVATKEMEQIWEEGWAETLTEITADDENDLKLIPKFLTKLDSIVRINGKYYESSFKYAHLVWRRLFLSAVFRTYLSGITHVSEFGCGSGHNLVLLGKLGLGLKKLTGYDRSRSAVKCLEEYFKKTDQTEIRSRTFDMREPKKIDCPSNGALLTVGAIEQLGDAYHNFVNFMIGSDFQIYIHIEPIYELYDPSSNEDFNAIAHHIKRGYPTTFLTYIRNLEKKGKVSILKTERFGFGARHIDGYSLIVWRKN